VSNATSESVRVSALAERAHADLPYSANGFGCWLRARLVEHWYGEHYWHELDRGDFGMLCGPIHPNAELVRDVVALILTGGENLTIIAWALETGRPLDDVLAILGELDVNAHRLPGLASALARRARAHTTTRVQPSRSRGVWSRRAAAATVTPLRRRAR
jgi:hypothetical protein